MSKSTRKLVTISLVILFVFALIAAVKRLFFHLQDESPSIKGVWLLEVFVVVLVLASYGLGEIAQFVAFILSCMKVKGGEKSFEKLGAVDICKLLLALGGSMAILSAMGRQLK